jgi:hypothetical protein
MQATTFFARKVNGVKQKKFAIFERVFNENTHKYKMSGNVYLYHKGNQGCKGTDNFEWKSLLCKVNFFPPKFLFPKYKRKNWREKIYS